ncbi:MAG: helix-turn-helix domain-containing protein [Alphaproteobacteria bacterium]|nr:helix-turn-helix domain-containing protein [Rhodospirillales bacterium]MCW9045867.1 helix-turn-helix domain-containing protein [Alphaproteobacteria bacterium]
MARRVGRSTPDPIDKYVGSRIRGRRLGLGMSQTKLGDAISVTFQQIQKYENGTNRVGASNLFRVSKVLNVNVGYFFQEMPEAGEKADGDMGSPDQSQDTLSDDPLTSKDAIELSHNYYAIEDEQVRKRIYQLVKSLAEAFRE